jgi:hypothetical protein
VKGATTKNSYTYLDSEHIFQVFNIAMGKLSIAGTFVMEVFLYREHEDTARLVCRAHGVPAPTIRSADRQAYRHTNRQIDK